MTETTDFQFNELEEESMTTPQHMIAGGAAGLMEHAMVFPIDTIKTRMQVLSSGLSYSAGVVNTLSNILKKEGVSGLFNGLSAIACSAVPAHALYFATYEAARSRLMMNHQDKKGQLHSAHFFASMGAGVFATAAHDAISTPFDVAKQRMQLGSVRYDSLMHCVRSVTAEHGLRAFWVSYPTTLLLNIPFTSAYFAAYETFKYILQPRTHDSVNPVFEPWKHIVAGSAAGATGAAISNPIDVVKTRLQTQEAVALPEHLHPAAPTNPSAEPPKQPSVVYRGFRDAAASIVKTEGYHGFIRGIRARMVVYAPSAAISWTTYEGVKFLLSSVYREE
eukprot:gb/GECH01004224.1/.p1 GENE.gb/GECH01004224.1/~~gb/GECH01004224.1/.p1  ORF type:complete len:334 (+),score=73.48 gb/GECH01004224.1/:1-1002(+)